MLLRPVVYDGGMQRLLAPGDILAGFEPTLPATDTTVTLSYTSAMLLTPTYVRNPGGASTDTFPTADQLISTLMTGLGMTGVPIGLSFRWKVVNLAAFLLTGAVTANTGVTMVRGNVLASTTKDFLVQVTNGTPLRSVTNITTTNASAVLTNLGATDLANLSIGMVVTNAVAGQQGNTIIAINMTAGTITMSGNSNATATGNTFTFSPAYTITGLAA